MRSGRARVAAVLAVALVAAAAVVVAVLLVAAPAGHRVAALPAAVAVPTTRVAVAAATTPARPAPVVPHDVVAPAAPTGFEIAGPAFDIRADVCAMANVRPLDPPGDQYHTVCWVREGFGVAPGTGSGGTSYVLGHAWAEAPLVLTPLSVTAMNGMDLGRPTPLAGVPTFPTTVLDGYTITLTTPNGVLTYTVTDAYAVAKERAADVTPLMAEHTPDRLVIITCGVHDSRDVDVNIVVDATLTSARAL